MIKLNYPEYPFKIKKHDDKELIFDGVRKKWVTLTPEEWVRQNMLQYLIRVKKYPVSLVAVEKGIKLGELVKRCDIVIYNSQGAPLIIIECKAMDVNLNTDTAEQIMRYNLSLPAAYLIITNGVYCIGFKRNEKDLEAIKEIPGWKDLSKM